MGAVVIFAAYLVCTGCFFAPEDSNGVRAMPGFGCGTCISWFLLLQHGRYVDMLRLYGVLVPASLVNFSESSLLPLAECAVCEERERIPGK